MKIDYYYTITNSITSNLLDAISIFFFLLSNQKPHGFVFLPNLNDFLNGLCTYFAHLKEQTSLYVRTCVIRAVKGKSHSPLIPSLSNKHNAIRRQTKHNALLRKGPGPRRFVPSKDDTCKQISCSGQEQVFLGEGVETWSFLRLAGEIFRSIEIELCLQFQRKPKAFASGNVASWKISHFWQKWVLKTKDFSTNHRWFMQFEHFDKDQMIRT